MDLIATEKCRVCNEAKNIDLFKKHSRKKSGYDTICRACHRKFDAAWVRTPYGKCLHIWRAVKHDCKKRNLELGFDKPAWMEKFLPEVTSFLKRYESVVYRRYTIGCKVHIDDIQLHGIKRRETAVKLQNSLLKVPIDPVLADIRRRVREETKTLTRQVSQIMDGYVYVITHPTLPSLVKIGRARDYLSRLSSFQTYDPYSRYKIEHFRHFPNRFAAESKAHALLDEWRIYSPDGNRTEWFKVSVNAAKEAIDSI